jgi:hypothetical protein
MDNGKNQQGKPATPVSYSPTLVTSLYGKSAVAPLWVGLIARVIDILSRLKPGDSY